MKKILLILTLLTATATTSFAQKFAYVDTKYILENIPEYQMAQNQLDELAKKWQKEIDAKIAEVKKMYESYKADAVLLPDDLKSKREDEIVKKEKEIKDLQKKRFGKDGDLYKKRAELIKPIQDKVFNAIEELAKEKGYAIVFDKAAGGTILYANPRFDKSDAILTKLGYTPGSRNNSSPGRSTQNSGNRNQQERPGPERK